MHCCHEEEVWGEEEIIESQNISNTLTVEGYRHGKLSKDENERQSGFNHGFLLGRKVGVQVGSFLAIIYQHNPEHLKNESLNFPLSQSILDPHYTNQFFSFLDGLCPENSSELLFKYQMIKSQLQILFQRELSTGYDKEN